MNNGMRAQAAFEYLMMFIFAMGIITAVVYVIFVISSRVGSVSAMRCNFDIGEGCLDLLVTSNSTNTVFAILGSNTQEYPINALSMVVDLNGKQTNLLCSPGRIAPGQRFLCFTTNMKTYEQPGYAAFGNLTSRVRYCGFNGGDCNASVPESFIGKYSVLTTRFKTPRIGLDLSKPVTVGNQSVFNATFNIFGVSLYVGTIGITQHTCNPVQYSVNPSSSLNVSVAPLAGCCAGMVNATYFNKTAIGVAPLNTSNFSSSSYHLSSQNGQGCLALANTTQSVKVTGQNNTAGIFSQPNITINVSDSGGQNTLDVFNSNAVVKITGNYNNMTFINSNVWLLISGHFNKIWFINSRISNLTESGNNNLVLLTNTTVGQETITGTNDIVQIT